LRASSNHNLENRQFGLNNSQTAGDEPITDDVFFEIRRSPIFQDYKKNKIINGLALCLLEPRATASSVQMCSLLILNDLV